jgi:hypothetical protein
LIVGNLMFELLPWAVVVAALLTLMYSLER